MEWWHYALMLVGSGVGAWVGVKTAVAVLQSEVGGMKDEIKSLRADRHKHAGFIQDHEGRLDALERWRDRMEDR